MLVNFSENYITVFATNFSYYYNALLNELQDLGHATRTGIEDQNQGRHTRLHYKITAMLHFKSV